MVGKEFIGAHESWAKPFLIVFAHFFFSYGDSIVLFFNKNNELVKALLCKRIRNEYFPIIIRVVLQFVKFYDTLIIPDKIGPSKKSLIHEVIKIGTKPVIKPKSGIDGIC